MRVAVHNSVPYKFDMMNGLTKRGIIVAYRADRYIQEDAWVSRALDMGIEVFIVNSVQSAERIYAKTTGVVCIIMPPTMHGWTLCTYLKEQLKLLKNTNPTKVFGR